MNIEAIVIYMPIIIITTTSGAYIDTVKWVVLDPTSHIINRIINYIWITQYFNMIFKHQVTTVPLKIDRLWKKHIKNTVTH